MKGIENF